jgi:hypothetical protein
MTRPRIEVTGLREFQRSLRQMDADLPKQIRLVLNASGEIVIKYARPTIPSKTGAARASMKLRSSQREARLAAGGRRAPYYPWLDFGGSVGPNDSVTRPFVKIGRYVYPTLRDHNAEIQEAMSEGLQRLATDAGLEMT